MHFPDFSYKVAEQSSDSAVMSKGKITTLSQNPAVIISSLTQTLEQSKVSQAHLSHATVFGKQFFFSTYQS